jgi:transcriptional regulator with XRE-family HTH domain
MHQSKIKLNLTSEREIRGWSKAELARRARLDAGLLSKIESRRVQPYPTELRRLARALHVTDPEWLLAAARREPTVQKQAQEPDSQTAVGGTERWRRRKTT